MKYFGTDGIRGTYGDEHINEEFFCALGEALGEALKNRGGKKIVAGGDTRASTGPLLNAFIEGFSRIGGDCENLGILPTPALAYGVLKRGADFGVMITASHNPHTDNGIKFFDSHARKIDDDTQLEIERLADKFLSLGPRGVFREKSCLKPEKIRVGRFALEEYAGKMSELFPKGFLKGVKIALDMANGATSGVSSKVFENYGAEVFCVGDSPDGFNINDGVGSQYPESLSELCAKTGADIGFAHDGDGDRVVVCDENSDPIDGEVLLGLIAVDALSRGALRGGAIVTTIQSNTGLDSSLADMGIKVHRSGIGDRLVMSEMISKGCNIGGENSGHFIFSDVSPCGDGLAAALAVLSAISERGAKLSEAKRKIRLNPLLQKAVKVARKIPLDETPTLADQMQKQREFLGSEGRILVRYSGTENKIRLLVESPDPEKNKKCMDLLESCVENDLK